MNLMVFLMWCCIIGLVFVLFGIFFWFLDDDYENCVIGCIVSDDVLWLFKN